MRNSVDALMVAVGSVLCPATFLVWSSTAAGPTEGSHDTAHTRVLPSPSVGWGTPGPTTTGVPQADPAAASLTPDEKELVAWAYSRFTLVGLDLPPVEVTFHDDTQPCGGHHGRFRGSGDRRQIAVCVPDWETFASDLQRQRTLVHELAHAWDHANLDAQARRDLLSTLDASDWYAPESEWGERGIERFAETIVWGLYDQLRRPTLIDVPCQELHADFMAITGFTAQGPLEPVCHTPSSVRTKGTRT